MVVAALIELSPSSPGFSQPPLSILSHARDLINFDRRRIDMALPTSDPHLGCATALTLHLP